LNNRNAEISTDTRPCLQTEFQFSGGHAVRFLVTRLASTDVFYLNLFITIFQYKMEVFYTKLCFISYFGRSHTLLWKYCSILVMMLFGMWKPLFWVYF